jgi:hypothetical protein
MFARFSNVTERGQDIKRLLDALYKIGSEEEEKGRAKSIPILKTFQA